MVACYMAGVPSHNASWILLASLSTFASKFFITASGISLPEGLSTSSKRLQLQPPQPMAPGPFQPFRLPHKPLDEVPKQKGRLRGVPSHSASWILLASLSTFVSKFFITASGISLPEGLSTSSKLLNACYVKQVLCTGDTRLWKAVFLEEKKFRLSPSRQCVFKGSDCHHSFSKVYIVRG